jgi:hypothetical protein
MRKAREEYEKKDELLKLRIAANAKSNTKTLEINALLQDVRVFLLTVPLDMKNGNTDSTGTVDEGQVINSRWRDEILSHIEAMIGGQT